MVILGEVGGPPSRDGRRRGPHPVEHLDEGVHEHPVADHDVLRLGVAPDLGSDHGDVAVDDELTQDAGEDALAFAGSSTISAISAETAGFSRTESS